LAEPSTDEIVVFGRRFSGIENPKLREVVVEDFGSATSYRDTLDNIDVAFWCLGVSQSAVSDEAHYREITVDYAMTAGEALVATSPEAEFHFVSGMGAGKNARPMWARVKAEAEEALVSIGFPRLVIWRPGYIHVPGGRENPTSWERTWEMLSPLFRLVPGLVNPVATIARAMLREALEQRDGKGAVLMRGSREILKLGNLKLDN
jgi:uncharacterized protein YbjT (DUF2867 family)